MALRPWWMTLTAKLVLSKLPLNYGFWAKLGIFRHGGMDDPSYAIAVFDAHVRAAGMEGALTGLQVLELGPGDSVSTAIIAASRGATAILIDAGDFAFKGLGPYKKLAEVLHAGISLKDCHGFDDLLSRCRGSRYLTEGLKSIKSLPSDSVDFLFSNAVLEHIEHDQFDAFVKEMRRVMKPGGVMSHEVDLRDHLGGGKNNMRFTRRMWESAFFKGAGFYTNRITCSSIKATFVRYGFQIHHEEITPHPVEPLRSLLAPEFSDISDGDLRAAILKIVLKA